MLSFRNWFKHTKRLAANPGVDKPLTLQVLFQDDLDLNTKRLVKALRAFHETTRHAICKDLRNPADGVVWDSLVGWHSHVIRMVGYHSPVSQDAVRRCARPFFKSGEIRETLAHHRHHLRLFYVGYDTTPFEQYVAMAVLGSVLSRFGAKVVMNHAACTAFPTARLQTPNTQTDKLAWLRGMPLPVLYCGLVTYGGRQGPGSWMRTHGAYKLGLIDIAVIAARYQEKFQFDLINSVLTHQLQTGRRLKPGATHRLGRYLTLRLREPGRHEAFLCSKNPVYVAEIVA